MTTTPDLQLKRLTEEEAKLADSLARSINPDDPGESWGTGPDGVAPGGKQIWGIFRHDALVCALWLTASPSGEATIPAMAVPRNRSRMGFLSFIVENLAPLLAKAGGRELSATITKGGPVLGEALEDAGFSGPEEDEPSYPAGVWKLPLA